MADRNMSCCFIMNFNAVVLKASALEVASSVAQRHLGRLMWSMWLLSDSWDLARAQFWESDVPFPGG